MPPARGGTCALVALLLCAALPGPNRTHALAAEPAFTDADEAVLMALLAKRAARDARVKADANTDANAGTGDKGATRATQAAGAKESTGATGSAEGACRAGDGQCEAVGASGHRAMPCTVETVAASVMTPELFAAEYYLRKPVRVTGVKPAPGTHGKPGTPDGAFPWSTAYLLEHYGNHSIQLGSSRTITKTGGTGHAYAKLADVVAAFRAGAGADVDLFAFDRNSHLFAAAPEFKASVQRTAEVLFGPAFAPLTQGSAEDEEHWQRTRPDPELDVNNDTKQDGQ